MVIYKACKIEGKVEIPEDRLEDERFNKFHERMKGIKNANLDFFYINLKGLKVQKIESLQNVDSRFKALYKVGNNTLYVREGYEDIGIDHELIHMSTTAVGEHCTYIGFSQVTDSGDIGVGITEGYTAIQDLRYHSNTLKEEFYKTVYLLGREMANYIEQLIGQDLMEEYFYKADFYSLIETLCNYMPLNKVVNFIHDVDILNDVTTYGKSNLDCIKGAQAYERCIIFLTEAFLYKYEYNYQAGAITPEEYSEGLLFCKSLSMQKITFPSTRVAKSRPVSDKQFLRLLKKCEKESKKNI